jgi:hypothetical protein
MVQTIKYLLAPGLRLKLKHPASSAKKNRRDMVHKKTPTTEKSQSAIFRKAARDLGCDESEAAFDAALGKIARHKPLDRLDRKAIAKKTDEVARGIGNKDD